MIKKATDILNEMYMEKEASRRWKQDIGALSPENRQKLVQSGILNYNKETEGLNKGSMNIAKKLGIKVNLDGKHSNEDLKNMALSQQLYDPYKSQWRRHMDKNVLINDGTLYREKYPNASSRDIHAELRSPGHTRRRYELVVKNNGDEIVSKFWSKNKDIVLTPNKKTRAYDSLSSSVWWGKDRKPHAIVNAAPDAYERMREAGVKVNNLPVWKDENLKKQQYALDLRHEIDEARTRLKQHQTGNIRGARNSYEWSHAAPSVLLRESVNAASLDPRLVKNQRKARSKQTISGHLTIGERLHNKYGEKYGQKGILDKKRLKAEDKIWYSGRNKALNSFDLKGRMSDIPLYRTFYAINPKKIK